MRRLFMYVFILIILCASSNYTFAMGPLDAPSQINKPAPKFSLYDLDTKWIESSAFKGKKIVLFFWTTWCPYCRKSLVKLQNQYPSITAQGIEVLGINIGESGIKVKNFLKANPVSFRVLLDSDTQIAEEYRIVGIPAYILVSTDGNIKFFGNDLPANYKEVLGK
ncbi:MAG: redoxin domain-containing protein [Candidatus Omnitrophota bacterium]